MPFTNVVTVLGIGNAFSHKLEVGKGVPLRPITLYPLTPNFGRYAPVFSLNDYSEVVNVIFCRQEDVRDGKPQT